MPGRAADDLDNILGLALHRLRTPLTTLKGWAALALREGRAGRAHEHWLQPLERVMTSVRELEQAIDHLATEAQQRLDTRSAVDGHPQYEAVRPADESRLDHTIRAAGEKARPRRRRRADS